MDDTTIIGGQPVDAMSFALFGRAFVALYLHSPHLLKGVMARCKDDDAPCMLTFAEMKQLQKVRIFNESESVNKQAKAVFLRMFYEKNGKLILRKEYA